MQTFFDAYQLQHNGKHAEALPVFLDLIAQQPSDGQALKHAGECCIVLGDNEKAIEYLSAAIALDASNGWPYCLLSMAYERVGNIDKAIPLMARAFELCPYNPGIRWNRSLLLLKTGNYLEGWKEYEWGYTHGVRHARMITPQWDGQRLEPGQTIYIYAEQGMGDTIMMARYIPIIQEQYPGVNIIFEVQDPLVRLMQKYLPRVTITTKREDWNIIYPFDWHVSTMALPRAFRTTAMTIPSRLGMIGLADISTVPKIGFCWAGSGTHTNDKNRSLTRKDFDCLQQLNADLVCLQFGEPDGPKGDMLDTLELIHTLDCVVTVDTAIAHLAASADIHTYLITGLPSDFRWGIADDRAPWYYPIDLFRGNAPEAPARILRNLEQSYGIKGRVSDLRTGDPIGNGAIEVDGASLPGRESVPDFFNEMHTDFTDILLPLNNGNPHAGDAIKAVIYYKIKHPTFVGVPVFKNPVPGSTFSLALTRSGPMLALRHDKYVGEAIHKYGEFSHAETALFERYVNTGMTVIEVGANIGAHTIGLAQLVGENGHVYAIEPQRPVFQALCGNVALAGLQNVYAIHAGASDTELPLRVPVNDYRKPSNYGGCPVFKINDLNNVICETVRGITLDSLCIDHVDFLKIDVEGHEREVLIGAKQLIAQSKPILYVENDRGDKCDDLIDAIVALGYKPENVFWHMPKLYNPDNFNGVKEDIYPGIISINLLCFPSGVGYLIDEADGLKHLEAAQ